MSTKRGIEAPAESTDRGVRRHHDVRPFFNGPTTQTGAGSLSCFLSASFSFSYSTAVADDRMATADVAGVHSSTSRPLRAARAIISIGHNFNVSHIRTLLACVDAISTRCRDLQSVKLLAARADFVIQLLICRGENHKVRQASQSHAKSTHGKRRGTHKSTQFKKQPFFRSPTGEIRAGTYIFFFQLQLRKRFDVLSLTLSLTLSHEVI